MSRFLNPAKIGLLALIELYAEEAVPNDAAVSVLSFITSHLLDHDLTAASSDPADRWLQTENAVDLITSLNEFEQLLSPFSAAVGLPGRRLWDIFLRKLWRIDSLDALHQFFDERQDLLATSKEELGRGPDPPEAPTGILLARNSLFGSFVRRSELEFSRLRFHSATELWKDFVRYRQPSAAYWRRRNPSFGRLSFDNVLLSGEHEWGANTAALASVAYGDMLYPESDSRIPVSTDDIEQLLEFQLEQMQKFGTRVPLETKNKFKELLAESHLIPSLSHYISYLDAWKSGDYTSSFDCLHRYFDYTMQNKDGLFYQYGLLNLAALQADFGCHREAVTAMLETVSTARENKDMSCLNFALNWLFHFGRAHPQFVSELESNSMLESGRESLAFLRVKARETGMWMLWSSALLSEARMFLQNGDSVAGALENMVRSSQVLVERNMTSAMGSQISVAIALWERLGVVSLSTMTCEVFLRCHTGNSSFEDRLRVTCHLAGLLVSKGKYDEAFEMLENIEENSLRSWKAKQYWSKTRGILKLTRELHRKNVCGAENLLSQLVQSKSEDLEPGLTFTIDALQIDTLARRGDLAAAFDKTETLLDSLKDGSKDISVHIHLLLVKANIFSLAGRPQKGFTVSMRAANMAWRARLLPLLWHAVGAIANILTSLAEFEAAAQLLTAAIPRCLELDADTDAATLYSLLADAYTGLAGGAESKSRRRFELLTRAHEALDSAFEHFAAVEDVEKECEMLAKSAVILRAAGDDALAEDYAARCLAIRENTDARAA